MAAAHNNAQPRRSAPVLFSNAQQRQRRRLPQQHISIIAISYRRIISRAAVTRKRVTSSLAPRTRRAALAMQRAHHRSSSISIILIDIDNVLRMRGNALKRVSINNIVIMTRVYRAWRHQ